VGVAGLIAAGFGLGVSARPAAAGGTSVVVTVTLSGNGQGYLRTDDGHINCVRSGGISSGTCKYTYDLSGGPVDFSYVYASELNSCYVTGDSCVTGGTGPAGILAPGSPDQAIGVTFRLLEPVTITVKKSGSGTVKSTPRGINCGSDCKSDYPKGSSFTLKATASSSTKFSKWTGGPCDGKTSTTCTFTVGSGPYTVTAVFVKKVTATPTPEITEPPAPTEAPVVTVGPTPLVPTPFPSTPTVPPDSTLGPVATSGPPTAPASDDGGRSTLILALSSLLVIILAAGGLYAMRSRRSGGTAAPPSPPPPAPPTTPTS
jgi:hypothetical protein